ncbi:NLP/P60 protein OS=Tsukamurella paurometabola (strain ATCC 8368 / DSM / CCUG 35730 / CIP 100753/ JCM 10117 / KCTC 9821 / NBRC 16120 / NCIMB 702349 / NCTC 13040) OX=521096 GN=Tpau_0023 PE=3 SV=1 [Tsukamurella paurometabola]|uniref:NLP/P60 protein n=1 Tax=Tsukamurella paurometabola (strain ATCC 8368 / DSM 20162 / CCUG 35730 / CIP 100753 / JCM 10117 / KCTC 9821 / NBRC 16120 / NCIMB 702349 / NCTC 13040) TaxID=521096 RepID=D5UPC5_TSUPD|nr:C40 family peptidase [Tsukamurella paurometabola]ADG76677.1 NLP/P60 protein [Tsukamurella paurometabola DSM 20162]SUP41181.1 Probable endopeptidase cgR_2070 precursor [Tsukamurella paurometabola]
MTSDSTKTTSRTRAAFGASVAVIGLVASPAVALAAPAPQLPAPQAPAPQAAAAPDRGAVVQAALTRVGMPYQYGASGPSSFDCSGLVSWAMNQAGLSVPRSSYSLMSAGVPVSRGELRPGDVVITNGGGHAALYVGNGQVVEAVTYGTPVRVSDIRGFVTARRF